MLFDEAHTSVVSVAGSNSAAFVQVRTTPPLPLLEAKFVGAIGVFLFCTDPVAIVPPTAGSARLFIKKASLLCSSAVMLTKQSLPVARLAILNSLFAHPNLA